MHLCQGAVVRESARSVLLRHWNVVGGQNEAENRLMAVRIAQSCKRRGVRRIMFDRTTKILLRLCKPGGIALLEEVAALKIELVGFRVLGGSLDSGGHRERRDVREQLPHN